jgi:hypothetical protein
MELFSVELGLLADRTHRQWPYVARLTFVGHWNVKATVKSFWPIAPPGTACETAREYRALSSPLNQMAPVAEIELSEAVPEPETIFAPEIRPRHPGPPSAPPVSDAIGTKSSDPIEVTSSSANTS